MNDEANKKPNVKEIVDKQIEKQDNEIDQIVERVSREKITRHPLHKIKNLEVAGLDTEKYKYYIATHRGDNIANAMRMGYRLVENDELIPKKCDAAQRAPLGKYKTFRVNRDRGDIGYLMKCPIERAKEIEKLVQNEVDETESQIGIDKLPAHLRRGKVQIDHSTS
jgi:hypothetical protein